MTDAYRVKVFMTGFDTERARQLREALSKVLKGIGKADLKRLLRRVYEGERVLIYESNDDNDAQAVAGAVEGGGAIVDIVGLNPPDDIF